MRGFTAFICLDDDSLGLYAALLLHQYSSEINTKIILRMDHNTSVATIIFDEQSAIGNIRNIFPVNIYELTANTQAIFAGEKEILAQLYMKSIAKMKRDKGQTEATNKLLISWDKLGQLTPEKDGINGRTLSRIKPWTGRFHSDKNFPCWM